MPAQSPPHAGAASLTAGSEEATRRLAFHLGRMIRHPLSVFLIGDLGSGKTVFVQGLARGLDVPAEYYVTSPSYTLINHYPGRLPLYHIDLYRLDADPEIEELGLAEILAGEGVAAVEWADKLPAGSAPERVEIRFTVAPDDRRILRLLAYGQGPASLLMAFNSICNEHGGVEWD